MNDFLDAIEAELLVSRYCMIAMSTVELSSCLGMARSSVHLT